MPRSSGTYSLPANTLAVSGTTISSTYYNAFVNDVAAEITASLPRDGTAAMTAKLLGYTGSAASPSYSFSSDATTGFYRKASGEIGISILGTELGYFSASGLIIPGGTVNRAYTENTSYTACSTAIPVDDTIPQVTEGTKILSAALTPSATTSRVRVRVHCWGALASGSSSVIAAVFRNGGADAIVTVLGPQVMNLANFQTSVALEFEDSPAAITAQTYTVRVAGTAGIFYLNGSTSARQFGGSSRATIVLEEIAL